MKIGYAHISIGKARGNCESTIKIIGRTTWLKKSPLGGMKEVRTSENISEASELVRGGKFETLVLEYNVVPIFLVDPCGDHHAGSLSPQQIRMPVGRFDFWILQIWGADPVLDRLERRKTRRSFKRGEVLRRGRPERDEILSKF